MTTIFAPNTNTIDLTAPPTSIGTTTPVAVNSTIFTALPANNTSALVASGNTLTDSNAQSLVNLSQTWNTTGTPTAIFANITDTASDAASKLLDLQRGGVSRMSLRKDGSLILSNASSVVFTNNTNGTIGDQGITFFYDGTLIDSGVLQVRRTGTSVNLYGFGYSGINLGTSTLGFGSGTSTVSQDVILVRDAANTLAQRNGVNSQTKRLYKSFTDASNYTRAAWQFDANGVVLAGESAGTGDANIGFSFGIKGTGAFQLQQTDSTTTGGNARGANAVDLQTSRLNATMIASGESSFVAGLRNTASALGAVALGNSNIASGSGAIALGVSNTASGSSSLACGCVAFTKGVTSLFALGSNVSGLGKNQLNQLVLGVQTTDATPTILRSNTIAASATNQLALQNNSALYVEGLVIANVTGAGDTSSWEITATVKRGANAASTALVGTPTVTVAHQDAGASGWVVAVTADTTNGCLAVTVTGQAATTIRWTCTLFASEVAF
jgi:hypothetical protein